MIGGPGRGYFQGAGFKGRDAGCYDSTTPMDQLDELGYIGYTVSISISISVFEYVIKQQIDWLKLYS